MMGFTVAAYDAFMAAKKEVEAFIGVIKDKLLRVGDFWRQDSADEERCW